MNKVKRRVISLKEAENIRSKLKMTDKKGEFDILGFTSPKANNLEKGSRFMPFDMIQEDFGNTTVYGVHSSGYDEEKDVYVLITYEGIDIKRRVFQVMVYEGPHEAMIFTV